MRRRWAGCISCLNAELTVLRRGVQFDQYRTGIETAQIYLGLKHQFPVLLSHRQRAEMNIVPVPGNLLLPSEKGRRKL